MIKKNIIFLIFIGMGILMMLYIILFTRLAPDYYVLLAFYFTDVYHSAFSIESFLDNTVVVDLLSNIILLYQLDNIYYAIGLLSLYIITFTLKYTYIYLHNKSLSAVITLFLASFISFDCNQMRYNLALLLLVISIEGNKKKLLPLAFITHTSSFFYKLLSQKIKLIYLLPLIPAIFFVLSSERYQFMIANDPLVFYKSFLLIIPVIIYNYYSNKSYQINKFTYNLSLKLYLGIPIIVFASPTSTARVIETVFVLTFYANSLYPINKKVLVIMLLFAISMFMNRFLNSKIGEEIKFIDDYQEDLLYSIFK